jgi:hypothetical protein
VNPVRWHVLTEETTKDLPDGWVFIAVSPKDYETLARNNAEMLRWSLEAAQQLRYYHREVQRP